jgi:hypothetical protein
MTERCTKYLKKILPSFKGATKESIIIEYLNGSRTSSLKGSVLSSRDAMQLKEEYRQHVLDCVDCAKDYFDFLKEEESGPLEEGALKKADREYLNIFGDRKTKRQLSAIRESSQ